MSKPIGLVLAGGIGRRLGRPKGDLVVEGQSLALRAARVLKPLCRGVLISVRRGAANPAPGFAVVEDRPPEGRGPLAGIHAAFEVTDDADLLVLACDYPRVESNLLQRLLERADPEAAVVLVRDASGREHPLVGLWRRGIVPLLTRALDEERYKVGALAERGSSQQLCPEDFPGIDLDQVLVNLNLRRDLDALGGEGPGRQTD